MRRVLTAVLAALFTVAVLDCARAEELSVPDLVKELRNGNVVQRWQAARLLGTLGAKARPAAIYLTIALRDESQTVRYYAARSLAAIGPAVGDIAGANLLHAAMNDPHEKVREEAAAALRIVDPTPLILKVPWLYAKADGVPQDAMAAFRVGKYKPIVELVKQLRDKDVKQRREAVRLLGRLKWRAAPAVTALTAALRDEDETVRLSAAEALGDIGVGVYGVAAEILQRVAVDDRSEKVRQQARQTLKAITPSPKDSAIARRGSSLGIRIAMRSQLFVALPPPLEQLTRQLRSDEVSSRRYAAWKLAKVQTDDPALLTYIRYALTDFDEEVRYYAVTALGRSGRAAGTGHAISFTVLASEPESQRVIRRAILAMQVISPKTAGEAWDLHGEFLVEDRNMANLEMWLMKLKGPDVKQQIEAIRSLGSLGIEGEEALPHLIPLLRHTNRFTRTFAAEIIGMIGFNRDSGAAVALAELADDDATAVARSAAIEALSLNLDADVVAELREPKPPGMPTPRMVVGRDRSLGDRKIKALVELLREEPEHRAMAIKVLRSRLDGEDLAPIVVPLAMGSVRELRDLGMKAIWSNSAKGDVAAPLAYALHHKLGKAHTIDLIDGIDAKHAFGPYMIPYVMRSDHERIREAGVRAFLRIGRDGDWRKILSRPWSRRYDDRHRQANRAMKSLDAKDAVVKAFIAGGMTKRDDSELIKFVIALVAATKEKKGTTDRLAKSFRTESSVVRRTIVWSLSREKPQQGDAAATLLVGILRGEPERSIRDAVVDILRRRGPAAKDALPGLLAQLGQEESTKSRMKIAQAIKVIGAGNRELLAIVAHLEESLRIQRAREILGGLISEQMSLQEEARRNRKRDFLRLLAN